MIDIEKINLAIKSFKYQYLFSNVFNLNLSIIYKLAHCSSHNLYNY
jgi:hypothetical protein